MELSDILQQVQKQYDTARSIRHELHLHPELSNGEFHTSELVATTLASLGIEVERGVGAPTAVIGTLRGALPGKTVGLRADMDALPITEQTDLPFCSLTDGVMHACGHDIHTSSLLGAAAVLASLRDRLNGTVRFYFEPAEENGGGGHRMIEAGCLVTEHPDAVIGAHISPLSPVGTVHVARGAMSAWCDGVKFVLKGLSSHGSQPHKGIDAVAMAVHLWMALNTVMTRRIDPLDPATLGLGVLKAGTAHNITAKDAVIEGTLRNVVKETREQNIKAIDDACRGVAVQFGGEVDFQLLEGYPAVVNNSALYDAVIPSLREMSSLYAAYMPDYEGGELFMPMDKPLLIGEDFGYFSEAVPSLFFMVGCGQEGGAWHTPTLKARDETILAMMSLYVTAAVKTLES